MEEIRAIHGESHEIYEAPKIAEKMRQNGEGISNKTVNIRAIERLRSLCGQRILQDFEFNLAFGHNLCYTVKAKKGLF